MSISSGPKVIKDSILVDLDAANFKFTPSTEITNTINPFTTSYSPYNNPGFSTTVTKTNEIFKNAPVYKVTFSPQDSGRITRLGSSEGFGLVHGFGNALLPNTPYMASVYFKTNYPLQNSSSEGFANTYSNISGWGNSSTGNTRYREGEWVRLYTRFFTNTVAGGVSYATGAAYDSFQAAFNTTQQTDVLVTLTVASDGYYTTTTEYGTVTAGRLSPTSARKVILGVNPYVSNPVGISGLAVGTSSILNHGTETISWTKLSTSNYKLISELPLTYYFMIRMPSTGGVNKTVSFYPIFTIGHSQITDGKYWKVTFNTSRLALNDVIETYWAAPMFEQTDRLYPSPYVIGTENKKFFISTTWPDLSGNNNNGILTNGPLYNSGNNGYFFFDGTDDYLTTPAVFNGQSINYWTTSFWIYPSTGGWLISPASGGFDHYVSYDSTNKRVRVIVIPIQDTTTYILNSTSNSIPLNMWTNVVISINNLDIKIYINGSLNASGTATANHDEPWTGTWRWCQRGTGQFSMQARLANIKIYNDILTADEVKQNFESFRKRFDI